MTSIKQNKKGESEVDRASLGIYELFFFIFKPILFENKLITAANRVPVTKQNIYYATGFCTPCKPKEITFLHLLMMIIMSLQYNKDSLQKCGHATVSDCSNTRPMQANTNKIHLHLGFMP